ncbi:hypothetical protein FH972_022402 [Carpinus fangiana]|uniref:AAA+ ATPase domain-containing protein n=1 Tax=Carpinus fangiana TaxID=176857 RepID=A0A5N6KS55_9ROSI|nr:hypothetical protein FH972_022402 [Carpinus fangiana]
MSDVEDNMEVDGGDVQEASLFSARSTEKGKRSAANLPVELEDSLPWVEKYRPVSLEDVSGHQEILQTINRFVEKNRLPHLLLYGPPGTGKTSTILALARRIYGTKNMRQMVLELNASDDRGIDVVREQIKTFSSTKQIFNSFTPKDTSDSAASANAQPQSSLATFKLIILDEADAMTSTAQMALRRIMEKYTPNTRFAIIANYTHKLSPALLSRCTRFRFSPLPAPAIRTLVDKVIATEHVHIAPDATDALVTLSKGDMRRALNVLQACHASTRPLGADGQAVSLAQLTAADAAQGEVITSATIHDCIAAPHPEDVALIRDTLLATSDVASCLGTLAQLKARRGLALADVLSALAEELALLEVPAQTRVAWLQGLAEVEYRLAGGGSETLQMGGMVGVVRQGVELMNK